MNATTRFVVAGSLLALVAGTANAQAVGYDVTRTWTECTLGANRACAELSLRTYGLANGGSHVAIGLANLQGTTPLDNMTGSLLYRARFDMSQSAGASSSTFGSYGAGSGGATGSPFANVTTSGVTLRVDAQNTGSINSYSASVYNSYYYCNANPCTSVSLGSYYSNPLFYQTYNDSYGIAGANPQQYNASSSSNTGYQAYRGTYSTYQQSYSCGWGSTCYRTIYSPYQYSVDAGVYNHTYRREMVSGQTPTPGAMFTYSFNSTNQYDARNVSNASFWAYNTTDGNALGCYDAATCNEISDVTVDNFVVVVATPEPASAGLVLTGLIGIGYYRRRRRATRA